jgi:hypothetical protein
MVGRTGLNRWANDDDRDERGFIAPLSVGAVTVSDYADVPSTDVEPPCNEPCFDGGGRMTPSIVTRNHTTEPLLPESGGSASPAPYAGC